MGSGGGRGGPLGGLLGGEEAILRDAEREGAVARAGVPCTLVRTGALRSVPAGSGGPSVLQVQSICCRGGIYGVL